MRQVDAAELAAIRGQSAPEPRDPIAVVSGMPRQPCSTAKPRRLFVLSKLLCIPTRLLLFAIGAGLCISLAYGFRYGQRFSAETQTGGLSIDERALDLGSVVITDGLKWAIPITNSTETDLRVADVRTSCGCTSVSPRAFILGPRRSQVLTLDIDLTPHTLPATGVIPFTLDIYVHTATHGYPALWTLNGTVQNPFRLNPSTLEFGEVIREELGTPRVETCRFTSLLSIAELTPSSHQQGIACVVNPVNERRTEFDVTVSLGGFALSDDIGDPITLSGKLSNGSRFSGIPIPVTASIVNDIEAVPRVITFPASGIGSIQHDTVVLASRLGRHFYVNDVVCPDGCDIEKISHQSVQEVYLLRQRVINVGKGESRLSFNIHVDDGTELSVPVIISYYGLKEQ